MRRFVEGTDRGQSTMLPECLSFGMQKGPPIVGSS